MFSATTGPFNPDVSMSKTRALEPYVQQKVNLPATLMARFTLLHWDPTNRKVAYGAVSRVVTELLTDYVNRAEGIAKEAPTL